MDWSIFKRSLGDYGVKWVFVEITNICNMHCLFCPSDYLTREKKGMQFDTFKKIIDELADLHPPHPIALHVVGEPLLHKDTFRFIDYCASKKLKLYLYTNCAMIKENIREICKRDNIDALVLSLQTPTEGTYELRRYHKPFRDYMQDIFDAIDFIMISGANKKIRTEIHVAETKDLPFRDWDILTDPVEGLETIKGICRMIKHDDNDFSDIPDNFIDLREGDYWGYEVLPNIFIRIKHFGTFGAHTLPGEIIEQTGPIECIMAEINLCILSDGTITACCLDTEGDLSLGNIQDTKIKDALKSKKRAAIIKNAADFKICRRCKGTVKSHRPGA